MPSAPQPTPHAQQPPQQNVAVLDGVLGRVTFSNRETGYTIARIAPDRGTGRGPVSADTERIKAGLAYTLSEAADDGHCYLPEHLLIADAAKILGVPENLITPQIPDLAAEELAVRDELPVLSAAGAG
jgi:hypothetical protein